jgi:polysaccharide biosynthesis transport protein
LRRSRIGTLLRGKAEPGLTDCLRGHISVSEVIQKTVFPNLFFVSAGLARRGEVSELINHAEFEEAVVQLRRQFDCVLIDCPPVNNLSDVGIMGRAGAEAVVVVRMNKTNRESVDRAVRLLHSANIKVSGMILTHQEYYIPNYLYRYS